MSTTNRGNGTIRSDVSVFPACRCRPLPAVPHDVPGDRDDGDRPQLVALDDGHTLQVDVAPADAERLADAHAGAEHEGDEVGQVAPARARLGTGLLLVLEVPCIHARNRRRSSAVSARGFREPASIGSRCRTGLSRDRFVLDREAQDQRHHGADSLPGLGALGPRELGEEAVELRDGALPQPPLPHRREDHRAEPLAVGVGGGRRSGALGDLGVELGQPELGRAFEGVVRPQRCRRCADARPDLVLQGRGWPPPSTARGAPASASRRRSRGSGRATYAAPPGSLLDRDAAVRAHAPAGAAPSPRLLPIGFRGVSVGFDHGSVADAHRHTALTCGYVGRVGFEPTT